MILCLVKRRNARLVSQLSVIFLLTISTLATYGLCWEQLVLILHGQDLFLMEDIVFLSDQIAHYAMITGDWVSLMQWLESSVVLSDQIAHYAKMQIPDRTSKFRFKQAWMSHSTYKETKRNTFDSIPKQKRDLLAWMGDIQHSQ